MEGFFTPTRLGGVLSDTPPGKVVCILQILAALPLSLCIASSYTYAVLDNVERVEMVSKMYVSSSGEDPSHQLRNSLGCWRYYCSIHHSLLREKASSNLSSGYLECPFVGLKFLVFCDGMLDVLYSIENHYGICNLWGLLDALHVIPWSRSQFRSYMTGSQDFKIDWKRTAITSMFGFGFVGPVGHFWFTMMNSGLLDGFLVMILVPEMFLMQLGQYIAYTYEGLDRFIRLRLLLQPASVRFVASKVAMDSLIFGPFELFVFFSHMGFSTGKNAAQVKEDLKRDFLPALIVESGAWPFVQVVNFRYVPVRYQLLYVNLFCLLDSIFLSWMEQQKDASWKQWFSSSPSSKEQGHGGGR
ncbi:Protein sym-1 [Vitis vinifera]|uniref:Protein sym-1 n=1 Tax=Vitis vinifera TaxID=29760 RepID=A0A438IHY6_VITVI|nr:Protein sym-1 [Vitis vinifera]